MQLEPSGVRDLVRLGGGPSGSQREPHPPPRSTHRNRAAVETRRRARARVDRWVGQSCRRWSRTRRSPSSAAAADCRATSTRTVVDLNACRAQDAATRLVLAEASAVATQSSSTPRVRSRSGRSTSGVHVRGPSGIPMRRRDRELRTGSETAAHDRPRELRQLVSGRGHPACATRSRLCDVPDRNFRVRPPDARVRRRGRSGSVGRLSVLAAPSPRRAQRRATCVPDAEAERESPSSDRSTASSSGSPRSIGSRIVELRDERRTGVESPAAEHVSSTACQ